jgi:hypothetical protein
MLVDNALSTTSENPVQNKVITGAINDIQALIPNEASTTNQLVDRNSLGTASQKDFTPYVSPDNTGLPLSSSVYRAITNAVYGAYHPSGSKTISELTFDLLVLANIGNVYKITEDGVTTNLFIGGAGQTIHTGDNAVVVYGGQPNTFLFDLQSGSVDLTSYQTKALASAVEGETTVEGALGALSTNKATQAEVNDIVNVLGAKNFVEIEDFTLAKTNKRTKSINKSDIKGEIPNEDVILSFIVSNSTLTVNGACFDVYDINNTRIGRAQFKEDGQYSIRFNSTNFRNLYIFISSEDSDSATCTISNIMIRLASITDDTYVPYAKTNKQITDVIPSNASVSDKLVVTSALNNRVREVFRIPYNMTITDFLARFVNIGIHVGDVFIQGDIGDTTVNSWCSYEANIVSITNEYVGDIKITNLSNGAEFLYKSYNTGSFNWVLVAKSDINTVTTGTATNTANVTNGVCTWVKKGSVVVVTINAFEPLAYTDGDRPLATGLPKPIDYTVWGANSVDGSTNQLFSIGTDGVLRGASGSMKNGSYYQTMTYLTND